MANFVFLVHDAVAAGSNEVVGVAGVGGGCYEWTSET
jgi:hypothetical protein